MLPDDELHVWRAGLDLTEEELAPLACLLSSDERSRAAQFHFERDRRRFTAGRGVLRSILATYIGCAADEVKFDYGVRGKPGLAGASLQFNLAHSEGLVVIGLSCSGRLGVDVERIRPLADILEIASCCFSPRERQAIAVLPPEDRLLGFFTCWIRKEAYLKATGDGIATALDSFEVPVTPGSPPKLLNMEGVPNEVARWSFSDLPLDADYLGVVAYEGKIKRLRHLVWQSPEV